MDGSPLSLSGPAFRSDVQADGSATSTDAIGPAISRWFSVLRGAEVPTMAASAMHAPVAQDTRQLLLLQRVLQKLELLDARTHDLQLSMDSLERAAIAHSSAMDTATAMIHGSEKKLEQLHAGAEATARRHAEAARARRVLLVALLAAIALRIAARHRHTANRIVRRVPFSLCMLLQVGSCAALGAAHASEAMHSLPLLGPLFAAKPQMRLGALACLYSTSTLLPYKFALELLVPLLAGTAKVAA